jgi:hypothetical protein
MIDLYDSEIIEVEKIIQKLNYDHVGQQRDVEGFVQRTIDMFARIGLRADVAMYTMADRQGRPVEGFMPEITIQGRINERGFEFDHDKMVHEVTNDLLGLGEGGVINTTHMKPGQAKG